MLSTASLCPRDWPKPYVVQEFIKMESPEVYRTYCAGGELFGWVARRFPEGHKTSPWVAHAKGAHYVILNDPPQEVEPIAKATLQSTGLWSSFGCVDFLKRPSGEWLVLEVNTDGPFNHVDRDVGDSVLEAEMDRRVAQAFWAKAKSSCF
jgi:glutathione synthase/RimK-type ligase-like ATP-grasp enzyme